jgi:transcriptional regulator with XRE-family HTH domain
MTQGALAKKMRTHQPAITRLESGRANPRLSTLVELAEALGATVRVEFQPVESERPVVTAWWCPPPEQTVMVINTTIINAAVLPLPPAAPNLIGAAIPDEMSAGTFRYAVQSAVGTGIVETSQK